MTAKEKRRAYRLKNKEALKDYAKAYYAREKLRANEDKKTAELAAPESNRVLESCGLTKEIVQQMLRGNTPIELPPLPFRETLHKRTAPPRAEIKEDAQEFTRKMIDAALRRWELKNGCTPTTFNRGAL